MRLPSTLTHCVVKASTDGDSTTSLGRWFRSMIILTVNIIFLYQDEITCLYSHAYIDMNIRLYHMIHIYMIALYSYLCIHIKINQICANLFMVQNSLYLIFKKMHPFFIPS